MSVKLEERSGKGVKHVNHMGKWNKYTISGDRMLLRIGHISYGQPDLYLGLFGS
jgi:hypothetical protein